MLNFFKVNDPLRLVAAAVYLVILGIVFLVITPSPTTEPRLLWMVFGERLWENLAQGGITINDTGPLSSGLFALVHAAFGRSELAYDILGRLLVLFQAIYWNSILIRYRVFQEITYLPAIVMMVLFHLSFDMVGLSPVLLGSTFLMLALGQLFSQTMLQGDSSEPALLIGIYGGIAVSFCLDLSIFLPYLILAGIAVSGLSFRQLSLSMIGFFLPLLLIFLFYYWNDRLQEVIEIWPLVFFYEKYPYQPPLSWVWLLSLPLTLSLAGYVLGTVLRVSTVNQQKQRQLIVLWVVFSALELLLVKRQATYQLVILLPGLTYLITSFFLNVGKGALGKIAFWLLLVGIPASGWWYWKSQPSYGEVYFTQKPKVLLPDPDATVMILGDHTGYYLHHRLGGPYLNYHLSKAYLSQSKTLEQKAYIFQELYTQRPGVVVDEEGIFKQLLEELPLLKSLYMESEPGIFILK